MRRKINFYYQSVGIYFLHLILQNSRVVLWLKVSGPFQSANIQKENLLGFRSLTMLSNTDRLLLALEEVKKRSNMTDPHLAGAYEEAEVLISAGFGEKVRKRADLDRHEDTKSQIHSAGSYLALAFKSIDALTGNHRDYESQKSLRDACKYFHYAAHGFRDLGNINRAADAYWRAGVAGSLVEQKTEAEIEANLAVRSLARAKICYQEIGIVEKSDQMHVLEWISRSMDFRGMRRALIGLWAITSLYGTSLKRWMFSLALMLSTFTILYELFFQLGFISAEGVDWTPVVSSFYFALVTTTTVGYGDIGPQGAVGQVAVVVNIFFGYVLFAIGTTILGRKVLAR